MDQLASSQYLFENFMKSNWEKYYKDNYWMKDILNKDIIRVIVLCSDIEDLVLKEGFINILREGL